MYLKEIEEMEMEEIEDLQNIQRKKWSHYLQKVDIFYKQEIKGNSKLFGPYFALIKKNILLWQMSHWLSK